MWEHALREERRGLVGDARNEKENEKENENDMDRSEKRERASTGL